MYILLSQESLFNAIHFIRRRNALEHLLVRFSKNLLSDWIFLMCLDSLVIKDILHKVGCPSSNLINVFVSNTFFW